MAEGLSLDAVISAIQSYARAELTSYSYYGDGSARDAIEKLHDDAAGIAAYALQWRTR